MPEPNNTSGNPSNSEHIPVVVDHSTYYKRTNMRKKDKQFKGIFSVALLLIIAGLLAWGLMTFVFQQYQVDGPSMEPTVYNGNRLIVWKVPRTWSRITGHPYIPNRGDIVIFSESNLYGLNQIGVTQLIKRVIGLPGDRVVIKNGQVTVYDKQYPAGLHPDTSLPYGKVINYTSGNEDIVVPPDNIFVCGDNRGDSLDSRVFGTVPVKNIIGKLVLRFTPVSEIEKF